VDIEFVDATDLHRFELRSGDELLGFIRYHLRDGVITMIHTEVDPAHGGHGYAARLAQGALDDARERGLAVMPSCPYVASYIEKHPEYADLVA
jgi:predicted GNAT family acetyltransferase